MKQSISRSGGGIKGRLPSWASGLLLAALLLAAVVSVLTVLLEKGYFPMERLALLGKLALTASTVFGSYYTSKKSKRGKLPQALLFALLFTLLLLSVSMLVKEKAELTFGAWMPLTLGCAVIGGFLGARGKRSGYV